MDKAIVFGSHDHLMGVLQSVAPEHSVAGDVAVVMVTPGMLHHAGPYRLHVELANELNRHGIASLRFDLSGIGESFGIGMGGRSIDRAASEIRQAVDWLVANTTATRVILFGLCSGADDSVHAALSDDRVVGVLAMDGCGYPTPAFRWHRWRQHVLPRLMRPSKWLSLGKRLVKSQSPITNSLTPGTDVREFPGRDEQVRQLQLLSSRGVYLRFVYTGGIADYYNHDGQFAAMFPELVGDERVTHHFFASMDHVAILQQDRRELIDDLCQHATKIAAATASTATSTAASDAAAVACLPNLTLTATVPMATSTT